MVQESLQSAVSLATFAIDEAIVEWSFMNDLYNLRINVSPEKISPPSNGVRLIFLPHHQELFELRHFNDRHFTLNRWLLLKTFKYWKGKSKNSANCPNQKKLRYKNIYPIYVKVLELKFLRDRCYLNSYISFPVYPVYLFASPLIKGIYHGTFIIF